MEPEGSLQHSQVSDTCPYPEPTRSSPYPHITLPEVHLHGARMFLVKVTDFKIR